MLIPVGNPKISEKFWGGKFTKNRKLRGWNSQKTKFYGWIIEKNANKGKFWGGFPKSLITWGCGK